MERGSEVKPWVDSVVLVPTTKFNSDLARKVVEETKQILSRVTKPTPEELHYREECERLRSLLGKLELSMERAQEQREQALADLKTTEAKLAQSFARIDGLLEYAARLAAEADVKQLALELAHDSIKDLENRIPDDRY